MHLEACIFDAQSMCIMIAMNLKFVKIENVLPIAAGSTFLKAACSICVSNAILRKMTKIENVLPAKADSTFLQIS